MFCLYSTEKSIAVGCGGVQSIDWILIAAPGEPRWGMCSITGERHRLLGEYVKLWEYILDWLSISLFGFSCVFFMFFTSWICIDFLFLLMFVFLFEIMKFVL